MNYIRFNPDHTVDVEPVPLSAETVAEIERHMLLIYTNQTRSADAILQKQSDGTADKRTVLRTMRDLADAMRESLSGMGNLKEFAALLHEGWELKRSLGFGISSGDIDGLYERARQAGAEGGKLLGAGGGDSCCWSRPRTGTGRSARRWGGPVSWSSGSRRHGSRVIFYHD